MGTARRLLIGGLCAASLAAAGRAANIKPGSQAQYAVVSSAEHQSPAVRELQVLVTGRQTVDGSEYWWSQMTMVRWDGLRFGVRLLSEHVPMSSPQATGRIVRYIYRPVEGPSLDYRDARTDHALLPVMDFVQTCLPIPAYDARYADGFASSGRLLGHCLVRHEDRPEFKPVQFDDVRVLRLRSDLLIGPQQAVKAAGQPAKPGEEIPTAPYEKEDFERMIAAGANYFGPTPEQLPWIINRPAFFRGSVSFPDTLYRSNYVPGRMFLDEPMTRLGWSGGIPDQPWGPEQVANILRMRLEHFVKPQARRVPFASQFHPEGTLNLLVPRPPSWETEYWSAWYHLAGGASGIIHEGRYVHRGYGWEPELLFGQGLEGLTDRDQFNCIFAFLRGAARAFGGYWGMSIYPEADPALHIPAVIRAYEMGARCIWFWSHAGGPHPTLMDVQEKVIRALSAYAAAHPRPGPDETLRQAEVGIVLPAGYAFNWYGTWGLGREELNPYGVRYGDISAAAMWEAILCSRRGIEFDFLVESDRIARLGYKRLVHVREDGSVDVVPPWSETRAARGLELRLSDSSEPLPSAPSSGRAEYAATWAGRITIDGDLTDWAGAEWIRLDRRRVFGDTFELDVSVANEVSEATAKLRPEFYLGMEFAQLDEELAAKYKLEPPRKGEGVVITRILPGTPAAEAGLREGDVILRARGRRSRWYFELYRTLMNSRKHPGGRIDMHILRTGMVRLGGPEDLAGRVALQVDDANLYLAADVTDDVHSQPFHRALYWKGDSVQIALAPTAERRSNGYGEHDHELGFVLKDGRPVVWRWEGCRGQPLGELTSARLAARREKGRTIYEAAIPLTELMPMVPGLWRRVGFDVVINDHDGDSVGRKSRLELCFGAMTRGKHPDRFASLVLPVSPDKRKVSAALFWKRRCMPQGGRLALVVAVCSPQTRTAMIRAELRSLDAPDSAPVQATVPVAVPPEPRQWELSIATASIPGRYKLKLQVIDPQGRCCASDTLPVYIYPATAR